MSATILTKERALAMNRDFEEMIADAKNWAIVSNRNNVTVRKRSADGQWIAQGVLAMPAKVAIQLLTEPESRLKWDKVFDNYVYVESQKFEASDVGIEGTFDVNFSVTHSRLSPAAGGMISSRDFLDTSLVVVADESESDPHHSLIWQSLDPLVHGDYISTVTIPPSRSASSAVSIRGVNHLGGCRISIKEGMDKDKECHMDYCVRSDIKGSVPVWLVDMGTGSSLESIFAEIRKLNVN
ncbi:hypothetical protein BDR26DRAFT_862936 [Obelidium mucronatum]|nr:hypothetical protein BDR26DRAFT_862936 [Obelidium mucronatum]